MHDYNILFLEYIISEGVFPNYPKFTLDLRKEGQNLTKGVPELQNLGEGLHSEQDFEKIFEEF